MRAIFIRMAMSDELYVKRVERHCRGTADMVFIAKSKDEIAGFINCKVKKLYGSSMIDLVAIHPRFCGLGIGSELLLKALEWFKERAEVVYADTQITNIAAINMYQHKGFNYLRS